MSTTDAAATESAAEAYLPPEEGDEPLAGGAEEQQEAQGPGLRENTIVPATVVKVDEGAKVVTVEFGWTSPGTVPLGDFARSEQGWQVKAGDTCEVLVELLEEGPPARSVLSKEKAEKVRLWDSIVEKCKGGGPVEGTIVAKVTGGYSVDIGVRAFLPAAQADVRRIADPEALIGERYTFTVTQFDKRRGSIVLTRRKLLEKELKAKKAETLKALAEGAVFTGVVKTLTDFGAFVDLGGVDGLLHVAELSWGRVGHAKEVLQPGQEVTVKVIKYDAEKGKVGLSLKALQEDPWAKAAERLQPGARVKGKVTGLSDFGAFVAIEAGVEGLVHVSQMSWTKHVKHPSSELQVGQEVEAQVLDLDPKQRRLSLSLRALQENPWSSLEARHPIGSTVKGRVKNVTDFGVFVGVEDGIDGLVHVGDLSWDRVKHPSELYKKGDEVEALVLNIDIDNERFSLGLKQLKADPWSELLEKHPIGSRLKGKVTRVVDFGAFVEIEPGLEGLVHVSELGEERIEDPKAVVKPGQELEVQVLDIDPHDRKASLSVRAVLRSGDDYRDYMDRDEGRASFGEVFGDKLKK
jgi:small subunit ribosomal protein S1